MILQLVQRSDFCGAFCARISVLFPVNPPTVILHVRIDLELHATKTASKSSDVRMSVANVTREQIFEDESFVAVIAHELLDFGRMDNLLVRS